MWWEEISFKDKSDLGLLTCLLSKGVDVLKKNDAGYTVLHHLLPAEQSKIRLALRGPPPPITRTTWTTPTTMHSCHSTWTAGVQKNYVQRLEEKIEKNLVGDSGSEAEEGPNWPQHIRSTKEQHFSGVHGEVPQLAQALDHHRREVEPGIRRASGPTRVPFGGRPPNRGHAGAARRRRGIFEGEGGAPRGHRRRP